MTKKKLLHIQGLGNLPNCNDLLQDIVDIKIRLEKIESSINTAYLSNWPNVFNEYEDLSSCQLEEILAICSEYTDSLFPTMQYGGGTYQIGPIIIYYVTGYAKQGLLKIEEFVIGFRIFTTEHCFKRNGVLDRLVKLKKQEDDRKKKHEEEAQVKIKDLDNSPMDSKRRWWKRK